MLSEAELSNQIDEMMLKEIQSKYDDFPLGNVVNDVLDNLKDALL